MRRVTINVGKSQCHYFHLELFNDNFSTGEMHKTGLRLVELTRISIEAVIIKAFSYFL